MIREPHEDDAEALSRFFVQLDQETPYMLFEPGERVVDIDGQRAFLHRAREDQNPLMLVAEQNGTIVGFCGLRREALRKNRHCASLVVGLLAAHRGRGLGGALVRQNLDRARAAGVTRVELSVVEENLQARTLYRKLGFREEGLRRRSLVIEGRYHAEVWMGMTFYAPATSHQGPVTQDFAELTTFLRHRHPGATLALAGSFARGTATPYSDFDVIAVQSTGAEPTRTAYRFEGRLVEVFCHTEASLVSWMDQNTKARKKSMASMLVDAKLLWGDAALLRGLCGRAAAVVAAGPPGYTTAEDEAERRWITETLDDVQGLGTGPEVLLLGGELFLRVLNYTLVKNRRWVTNGKSYRLALDELPAERDAFARALNALGDRDAAPLIAVTETVLARFGGRLYEDEASLGPEVSRP